MDVMMSESVTNVHNTINSAKPAWPSESGRENNARPDASFDRLKHFFSMTTRTNAQKAQATQSCKCKT